MTQPIQTSALVGVIGAGAMGAGIAQVAALAGHTVLLHDLDAKALDKARTGIAANVQRLIDKKKLDAIAGHAAIERVRPVTNLADMRTASLVIEAVAERLDVKRALFTELESIVAPECILATNTSSISITAIAAPLKHPSRVVGMHFFNPAPLMALVEVVSGLATSEAVAQTVYATSAAWGKKPVFAKSTPGFIVNRVARPFYAEALRVLNEQGADAASIDAVMRDAGGFRMGPFELMDLIGHDVNFAVTQSVFNAYFNDPRFTPSLIQQELVNAGFLGRKTGRGFYDYAADAAKPAAHIETNTRPPSRIVLGESAPLHEGLQSRIAQNIASARRGDPSGLIAQIDDAYLFLTDGRTATERAHALGIDNVVLIDLALDYANARSVAITRARQCADDAYAAAAGALTKSGYAVVPFRDVAGMAVMCTVAMLVNEAADAVNQGVCTSADLDLAMEKGVNYPLGPLAWGERIGIERIHDVLLHLAAHYGEDRYRASPLISALRYSGQRFH
ncbi:3-hydroxyacyl-CoA dehydrogenase PaaH [Caballeronia ptereochthonis]|uniref:3-hydroxyacyl-CoA dehydrogenase n=1 Tax=Caballeronia ptereochthonis TaxID=1777144 RepID=A0A158AA70_9BURK|nr:3-hydroxyacyl-CoA dehydrogenase PaaH [Caballeronia ptereochthonis]SAK54585.1 3-hydroxyacyl-CoA dehydrogenase [Caballeronia ptereochthonis]